MTKICIPIIDNLGISSPVAQHFGKTALLALVSIENDEINDIEIIEFLGKHAGGRKTPTEIVSETDSNILICGNLGFKAIKMLDEMGLEVYTGATGNIENAIQQWQNGELRTADEKSGCTGKE